MPSDVVFIPSVHIFMPYLSQFNEDAHSWRDVIVSVPMLVMTLDLSVVQGHNGL